MFKKKPTVSSLNARGTGDRIIADFKIDVNAIGAAASGEAAIVASDETQVAATPLASDEVTGTQNKEATSDVTAALSQLRQSLLPSNSLSAKFSTTSGPQLQEVHGTVYIGSHGPGEQRILWVNVNDRMYPTVYTLWKNPKIVPLLHTPSIVVKKLQGGADLMTPGLAGPPFPSGAVKGAVVAIASLENPSVPMAVGTCSIDISALKDARGSKGAAVQMFHWAGDDLWDWSTSGKAGQNPPSELSGWLDGSVEKLEKSTQELSLQEDDNDGGVSLADAGNSAAASRAEQEDEEDLVAIQTGSEQGQERTTKEIDESFRNAFLYGVCHHKWTNPNLPKHGLDFPLSPSYVMSHLVLPFLPTFTERDSKQLVIKNTSWKNLRKFIKGLDKDKLLLSKEKAQNDIFVWDIDFDDPAFTDFVAYPLPKKESKQSVSKKMGHRQGLKQQV